MQHFIWHFTVLSKYMFASIINVKPGRVAQLVTCLTTDARLTADPGIASSIPALSHTFVEIVSYKRKYVHELLINPLFKLVAR